MVKRTNSLLKRTQTEESRILFKFHDNGNVSANSNLVTIFISHEFFIQIFHITGAEPENLEDGTNL